MISGNGLEELYGSEFDRVYRYALVITRTPQVAEEIAQESFLRLIRFNPAGAGVSNLKHWLFRVAHNLAIDYLRRPRESEVDSDGSLVARTASPEGLLHESERRDAILKAISELSPLQRYSITLREYGGLSYREIASVLGVSVDQVKVQIHRSRQNLRKTLEKLL